MTGTDGISSNDLWREGVRNTFDVEFSAGAGVQQSSCSPYSYMLSFRNAKSVDLYVNWMVGHLHVNQRVLENP